MKKDFLIYWVDSSEDPDRGDPIHPLWCCESEDKAKSDVQKLQLDFDIQKKQLDLCYSMVYLYQSISVY